MANNKKPWTRKHNIGAPDPQGAPIINPPELPKGYRARCERCRLNFKTLEDLQAHNIIQHNSSRQRMPL